MKADKLFFGPQTEARSCGWEQVEAARKGLDQAKEEGLKLPPTSDSDDEESGPLPCAEETLHPTPNRRHRKHKEKGAPSTRASGRLRGATIHSGDPSLTQTHAQVEQDKGNGMEVVNLDKDLAFASLAQSAHVPQQHHVAPVSVNLTPQPLMLREVPDRGHCALQGREVTKDFSASTKFSSVHPEQAQPMSPFPRVLEPTKPGRVCPSSGSDLMPGSQSAPFPASPLHLPSLMPSTAFTPAAVNLHTLQAPLDSPCHSLSGEVLSTLVRSPRKRQSADGEVLSGLPEDSPSAKVLRKLPGRLVTVVEDKEPKRRKRGASGGGGSAIRQPDGSAQTSKSADELSRGTAPQTPDGASGPQKENATTPQTSPSKISPLLQVAQNSSSAYPSRAGVISPYSPTHHSPDMPVLRNLPVRRRLETESRMAAQLGEQQPGRGRGRGERRASLSPNFPRKKDTKLERSKDSLSSQKAYTYVIPNVNTTSPGKRKRGRPPKTPPRVTDSPTELSSPPLVMEMERTGSVEGSPSSSPRRKRGRPRKDSSKHSSSSSDTDESCGDTKEQRLTRAAQKKLEQAEETGEMEVEKDGDNRRRSARTPDRGARAEHGSNVSARVTRKSSGPQPSLECRSQSPAVPEVLGKRCSALNAAAKLLAMRGRGGNEGSSGHRGRGVDKGGRGVGQIMAPGMSNKMQGRVSGETNSWTDKTESSRQVSTNLSPTASRSTRQRPGCLVPPLELETKRGKKPAKKATKKEVEGRGSGSPRGQSTCSSASSEGGEGSSRSRSSSMSSQRTHSLSSQSTGPLCSHSRAPSSCSDQERSQEHRDQPGEKRSPRERADRGRKSRKEKWRHQERDPLSLSLSRGPEFSTGSSEGTPDRVLRSVAALAAAQARTPASNTRSSSTHHHQQQTHSRRTKT
ncbi:hypothetical protein SKAU_G00118950 [Synaphobranchus kaupii]|uniref:Uncharacterized protein n=1 Tax=Synaphobranchus kaupii TaxID=118154 RepID=A0A9Q1J183_SYNKA|nr:hypothetical protein SKAU_G00118950 [Synaphobranchus kaupii]